MLQFRKKKVVLAKNRATGIESVEQSGFRTNGVRYIGRADSMDGLDEATIFVHSSAFQRSDWRSFAEKINVVNKTLGTLTVIFL